MTTIEGARPDAGRPTGGVSTAPAPLPALPAHSEPAWKNWLLRLRPHRLRNQLFLGFALIGGLPLLALGFSYSRIFQREEVITARSGMTRAARAACEIVSDHLEMHRRAIETLALTTEQLDATSKDHLPALLALTGRTHPGFITLLAANAHGDILAAHPAHRPDGTPVAQTLFNVSDREYFTRPRQTGAPFISGVFLGRGFGSDPIVAVSAPVHSRTPAQPGIVEGSLDLRYLRRIALSLEQFEGAFAVVTDPRGRVVYSTTRDYPVLSSFFDTPAGQALRKASQRNETDFVQPAQDSRPARPFLAVSIPVNLQGQPEPWHVMVGQEVARVHAASRFHRNLILLGLLGSLAGALLFARHLAQLITRPIEHLAETARQLALASNPRSLQGVIEANSFEVARLVDDFDAMARRLGEAYRTSQQSAADKEALNIELRRVLQGLDRAVHERTAELAEARDQAEAASRAKSDFLALMSHEIRTPLNAILGYAQLMRRDPTAPPALQRNVDTILRSGEILLTLLSDILDMARLQANRVTLNPQRFRLRSLLSSVEAMFQLRLQERNIAFHLTVEDPIPPLLFADEAKIRQILVHLLGNAAKFTESGSIRVTASSQPLSGTKHRLRILVADTGCGIPTDELNSIFEAFEQAQAGRHKGKGSGLGLSISRRLARMMGGDITARSQVALGSVFQFEFEAESLPEQATDFVPATSPAPRTLAHTRVLLADDNPDNLEVLTQLLNQSGCTVTTAHDGRQALSLCDSWNPHLLILDLRMPVVDGSQVLEHIRTQPHHRTLPVIMLSADVLADRRQALLDAGATAVLAKPIDAESLLRAVHQALELTPAAPAPTPPTRASDTTRFSASLPILLRQQLRDAAQAGDADRVISLLASLEPTQTVPIAHLQDLARHYRYDQILTLLEPPLSPPES